MQTQMSSLDEVLHQIMMNHYFCCLGSHLYCLLVCIHYNIIAMFMQPEQQNFWEELLQTQESELEYPLECFLDEDDLLILYDRNTQSQILIGSRYAIPCPLRYEYYSSQEWDRYIIIIGRFFTNMKVRQLIESKFTHPCMTPITARKQLQTKLANLGIESKIIEKMMVKSPLFGKIPLDFQRIEKVNSIFEEKRQFHIENIVIMCANKLKRAQMLQKMNEEDWIKKQWTRKITILQNEIKRDYYQWQLFNYSVLKNFKEMIYQRQIHPFLFTEGQSPLPHLFDNRTLEDIIKKVNGQSLTINRRFMQLHPNLTNNDRALVVNYMLEVGSNFECQRQTVSNAIYILDKYLQLNFPVTRDQFQLIACSCLLLSEKTLNTGRIDLQTFCKQIGKVFTGQQILKTQMKIISTLGFKTQYFTINKCANIICAKWDLYISERQYNPLSLIRFKLASINSYENYMIIAQLIDISLFEETTCSYKTYIMAAALFYLTVVIKAQIYTTDEILTFRNDVLKILNQLLSIYFLLTFYMQFLIFHQFRSGGLYNIHLFSPSFLSIFPSKNIVGKCLLRSFAIFKATMCIKKAF